MEQETLIQCVQSSMNSSLQVMSLQGQWVLCETDFQVLKALFAGNKYLDFCQTEEIALKSVQAFLNY